MEKIIAGLGITFIVVVLAVVLTAARQARKFRGEQFSGYPAGNYHGSRRSVAVCYASRDNCITGARAERQAKREFERKVEIAGRLWRGTGRDRAPEMPEIRVEKPQVRALPGGKPLALPAGREVFCGSLHEQARSLSRKER